MGRDVFSDLPGIKPRADRPLIPVPYIPSGICKSPILFPACIAGAYA
ncbi:MAG: hypothetical protein ACPK85_03140 [Methanosarcina sp.]